MKMRLHWLWLPMVSCLAHGGEEAATAVNASLVLKVNDREAAARTLIARAEGAGGYFSSLGNTFVIVKLPNAKVEAFLAFCDSLGLVIDRHYEAIDYSSRIADNQVKIKTRRDLLKDYFDMLQQSSAGSVLSVENATSGITTEIESLEADLKVLRHRIDFAEIRVDFEFRERHAPLKTSRSLFRWINTLNLSDLRQDFENGRE